MYYELSFDEFIEEIKKENVNTKKRSIRENLEEEFNNSLNIINPLRSEIKELEKKLNSKIYPLYDLNDEELKIIEENI